MRSKSILSTQDRRSPFKSERLKEWGVRQFGDCPPQRGDATYNYVQIMAPTSCIVSLTFFFPVPLVSRGERYCSLFRFFVELLTVLPRLFTFEEPGFLGGFISKRLRALRALLMRITQCTCKHTEAPPLISMASRVRLCRYFTVIYRPVHATPGTLHIPTMSISSGGLLFHLHYTVCCCCSLQKVADLHPGRTGAGDPLTT